MVQSEIFEKYIIEAEILTGCVKAVIVSILKILMIMSNLFKFKHLQFSMQLSIQLQLTRHKAKY